MCRPKVGCCHAEAAWDLTASPYSDGKPITSGVCNKPLVIGLSISLFFGKEIHTPLLACRTRLTNVRAGSVLVLVLAVLVWFKFRRRKNDAKMMAELGIDTMRSPSRDSRETTKTVIVKLPALSVPIPPGKVAGEVPRSPDSIVTPASFHVGQ